MNSLASQLDKMKNKMTVVRLTLALRITLGVSFAATAQQHATLSDDAAASRIAW